MSEPNCMASHAIVVETMKKPTNVMALEKKKMSGSCLASSRNSCRADADVNILQSNLTYLWSIIHFFLNWCIKKNRICSIYSNERH